MPWFPDPAGGAPIQAPTNPNPAGGSYGLYSDPGYSGPPPLTGGSAPSSPSTPSSPGATPTQGNANPSTGSVQQLGNQINSLLGAIASGNKQAFDEAVRQFNVSFGLDKDKFTEAIRQFNENLSIAQSGVTGVYNGQQTQQAALQAANIAAQVAGLTGYYNAPNAATGTGNMAMDAFNFKANQGDQQTYLNAEGGDRQKAAEHYFRDVQGAVRASVENAGGQWNPAALQSWLYGTAGPYGTGQAGAQGVPTMAREQQTYQQQLGAIQTAAALQANPFRQAQAVGQLGGLLRGTGVAGFQAPGAVQGQTDFSGMGNMQRLIDDIRGGPNAMNWRSTQGVFYAIPTPNKVDSVNFMRSSPGTQNIVLQGMQEKYGLAPDEALAQIKNTLPQFQSPTTTFGGVKR
jgi:hypothetical protein